MYFHFRRDDNLYFEFKERVKKLQRDLKREAS
jgi:hypothetical protein